MEGLLIVGGLALVGYALLGFLAYRARRSRSKLERALNREQQWSNVAQAKLRAAQEHAEQVRTRTLAWDRPTRDGVVGRVDAETTVLEPIRDPQQILADFSPLPPVPSWRDLEQIAGPAQAPAHPAVETPESSPLYAETLAALPVIQPEADLLVPEYDQPRWPELADLHDVEPLPADEEEVPQDESRVTDPPEDDDTDPPAGPPSEPGDTGERVPVPVMAAAPVPRYAWPRHIGPLGPWRPSDKLRTWAVLLTRRAVTRLTCPPQVRIRHLAGMWAGGELTMLMSGIPSSARAVARHRRGGGTWAVAG